MKKIKRLLLNYTVIFEPAEEGGYVVHVPYLPGCVTQGDTFEEAMLMATDAIRAYLHVLKQDGDEIPVEPNGAVVSKVSVAL
jgi:predicted RNase H-like HicB family nuclease